jgi:hypothetical protein
MVGVMVGVRVGFTVGVGVMDRIGVRSFFLLSFT